MNAEHDERPATGRVFGEAAEAYDAGRPGYADELAGDVLEYAALGDRAAVEFGAGTGKATVPFAARGVPLVCVEPDPRMAAVLRRNTAPYPRVGVEVAGFEEWRAAGRRFGLLFAATAWHWFAPAGRWDLVHERLEPGGTLALFWNPQGVLDPALHAELAAIDRRWSVTDPPHAVPATAYGDAPGDDAGVVWPGTECRGDDRFTGTRSVRYRRERHYGTERYLAFLTSVSAYRVLPPERRAGVLADTARLLDARGGGIDMLHLTDLFLARAR